MSTTMTIPDGYALVLKTGPAARTFRRRHRDGFGVNVRRRLIRVAADGTAAALARVIQRAADAAKEFEAQGAASWKRLGMSV